MKKYIFSIICILGLFTFCNSVKKSDDGVTTYYLIRHSEKDRSDENNRNPNLNEDGEERAQNWASYFEDIELYAVYSTNYNRTIQTATPTAASKSLEIQDYDPRNMYDEDFQKATKGKTVLVVGHSNTTPSFANKILGEDKYEDIDDSVNSMLFIVTINGDKKTSEVKEID